MSLVKSLVHEGLQTKIKTVLIQILVSETNLLFKFTGKLKKKKKSFSRRRTAQNIYSKFFLFLLLSCCVGSALSSEDVCRHVAVGSQWFHHQKDLHVVFMKDAFSNTEFRTAEK